MEIGNPLCRRGFLNYNHRCRVLWHNFCLWKAVECPQNFSAVFREAVHAPPELKLSLLSRVCNKNDIFSVPYKSSEIDSNCF